MIDLEEKASSQNYTLIILYANKFQGNPNPKRKDLKIGKNIFFFPFQLNTNKLLNAAVSSLDFGC